MCTGEQTFRGGMAVHVGQVICWSTSNMPCHLESMPAAGGLLIGLSCSGMLLWHAVMWSNMRDVSGEVL
jgi:hypothetical protein